MFFSLDTCQFALPSDDVYSSPWSSRCRARAGKKNCDCFVFQFDAYGIIFLDLYTDVQYCDFQRRSKLCYTFVISCFSFSNFLFVSAKFRRSPRKLFQKRTFAAKFAMNEPVTSAELTEYLYLPDKLEAMLIVSVFSLFCLILDEQIFSCLRKSPKQALSGNLLCYVKWNTLSAQGLLNFGKPNDVLSGIGKVCIPYLCAR